MFHGLKGIEPIRDNIYIRPLIESKRSEIEKYCIEKNLEPRYDKTNKENIYTRNKVRNLLIPYIEKEYNPNFLEGINRLSILATEDSKYFEEKVLEGYKQILIEEDIPRQIVLDLKKFNLQDYVIKKKILLHTINELFGTINNIEKIHIEDMVKLCDNNIGNKFLTQNKKFKILIKNKFFQAEDGIRDLEMSEDLRMQEAL